MYVHYLSFDADGSVDFSALLDLLNQSSQTAVRVKSEVFQTILRIFQLDSAQKGTFRDVCGFHYLISVLASLIGSLAPRRTKPWIGGGIKFSLSLCLSLSLSLSLSFPPHLLVHTFIVTLFRVTFVCPCAVPRLDIIHLVQLVFALLTSAMHDDPANRSYFELNVSYMAMVKSVFGNVCK